MKVLLCSTTFGNVTNGPTKFANYLFEKCGENSDLEVHILSEDVKEEAARLHQCRLGFIKKVLPVAPVYRMLKYFSRAERLNKLYEFDFIIYNNAIYGLIHAIFRHNVVGMINDYNNQENISPTSFFNYNFVKKKIFKWFEKKAISYSCLILTNSNFLTKALKSSYPKYASKIFRLYKGIEFKNNIQRNDFHWNVRDIPRIKILFVKNDFVTGGLGILAESLANIDLQFEVIIIGPASSYFDQIALYFTSGNIKVNFLGRQSPESVYSYLATSHIFCVPSLQEALGVANLEALQVGIPVVSSDAGGIPEVLDYGNCGFLSKSGDPLSLTGALINCLFEKKEREEKVIGGFSHIENFKSEFIPLNIRRILNDKL